MTALAQHIAEPAQKAFASFADFCVYDAWRSSDENLRFGFIFYFCRVVTAPMKKNSVEVVTAPQKACCKF